MLARLAFCLAALGAGSFAYLSAGAAFADVGPKTVDGGTAAVDAGAAADDPMPACMAGVQKALELEKVGKLLDARKQLTICAAPVCGQYVSPACQKRIVDITGMLSSITLLPKDAEGSELQGVQVTIDGGETRTLDGHPIALDPGPHTFRFEALGLRPSERTLVLVQGAQGRQEQVVVGVTESPPPGDAGAPAEGTPAPAASAPTAEATPAPPPEESTPDAAAPVMSQVVTSPYRSVPAEPPAGNKAPAFVVGGVGLLGLAVGSVLGAMAMSDWNASKSDCSTTNCTASLRPKAVTEHDSAKTEAAASSVAFVLGGVAIAVGAYLYLSAAPEGTKNDRPRTSIAIAPSVSPDYAGLSLHGDFK